MGGRTKAHSHRSNAGCTASPVKRVVSRRWLAFAGSVAIAGFLAGCIGVYGQTPAEPESASLDGEKAQDETPIEDALTVDAVERDARVNVVLAERHQTLEGFGAAVAWYQDTIVGPTADGLYDLLFPELGLDILRLRNRFERSDPRDANLEQDVEIFERATKALGYPPKLMLSSWSPPADLKESGKERCFGNETCTLKKNNGQYVYAQFADWWLRSLQHYESLGLVPTYISIQNEPDFIPGDWEGCKLAAKESAQFPGYGKALAAVHARLPELSFRPELLGPEVLGIHYNRIPDYLSGLDATLLDGLAHHIYESGADKIWDWRDPGPDSFLDEMLSVRASTSLPIYQTEFNTDEDKGIDGGFETAWLVHHTMVAEQAVAFLYWDLVWSGKKGLVTMAGRKAKPRDQYYSMKHFARYTDPGDVRVGATSSLDDVLVSAYHAADANRLTVVLLNKGQGVAEVSLSIDDFHPTRAAAYVTTYRPGHSRRWQEQAAINTAAPAVRLPARSVATVVLTR